MKRIFFLRKSQDNTHENNSSMWCAACACEDQLKGCTCISAGLQSRAVHLDVINQREWIAGVRLSSELRRKGPFWGWTDPNRLWQGSYWKQVLGLRSAVEAGLASGSSSTNGVRADTGCRGHQPKRPRQLGQPSWNVCEHLWHLLCAYMASSQRF